MAQGKDEAAAEARARAKRERRLARKAQRQAAAQRAQRMRQLRNVAAVVVLLVALVGAGLWLASRSGEELEGVERPADEGRRHLAPGETFDYDDPAPTSGPHAPGAPPCGEYDDFSQLPLVNAVHALEHGAVILWHRPGLDEVRADLLEIMSDYDSHVIVSPNPGIDADVVATAWRRRQAYDAGDPAIAEFVDVYRQRGPERVDCPI